jgi:hypothetical protein
LQYRCRVRVVLDFLLKTTDHASHGGVLKPVVERYQGKVSRIHFRADAAFAMPEV